jgi:hypothetical protein
MQLSKNTLEVLKNYATINESLFVKSGNMLRTVSKGKTVLAEATVDETFPSDFGILELNQLLSILSLHKDSPELLVNGNDVVIKGCDQRSKITYRCCDETMIKVPPRSSIAVPSEDATFLLTESDLDWITRAANVLTCPNIAVIRTIGMLSIRILDAQNDSAHTDTLEIEKQNGPDCYFLFKTENWKMLPGTYKVIVSAKGVAHFESTTRKIQYWIALEQKAK